MKELFLQRSGGSITQVVVDYFVFEPGRLSMFSSRIAEDLRVPMPLRQFEAVDIPSLECEAFDRSSITLEIVAYPVAIEGAGGG